ncbi:12140_t:CDS:2, partial [Funneliformis mosseae]
ESNRSIEYHHNLNEQLDEDLSAKDNTDVSEDSMPNFPSYNENIGANNDQLEEEKLREC